MCHTAGAWCAWTPFCAPALGLLWRVGVLTAAHRLSLVLVPGGFSHFRAQALEHVGFDRCAPQVQLPSSTWDLHSPTRLKLLSPLLEGGFLTAGPPGKSQEHWDIKKGHQELYLQEGLQKTSVREDEGVFLRLRSEPRDSGVIPKAPVAVGPMRRKPGAA